MTNGVDEESVVGVDEFREIGSFEFTNFAAEKVLRYQEKLRQERALQARIDRDNALRRGKTLTNTGTDVEQ